MDKSRNRRNWFVLVLMFSVFLVLSSNILWQGIVGSLLVIFISYGALARFGVL
ncbi:MAG: hypothetical protein R3D55_06855 [Chloroflexota bacterium]